MKIESVAEFLARGGNITKVPSSQPVVKAESVKSSSTNAGAVSIITMDEVDLYYGTHKAKKAKKKAKSSVIDVSALPEELRKKYIDGVMNDNKEESN